MKRFLMTGLTLIALLGGVVPLQADVCDEDTASTCSAPAGLTITSATVNGNQVEFVVTNSTSSDITAWLVFQIEAGGVAQGFQKRVTVAANTSITWLHQLPAPITLLQCAYLCTGTVGDDPDPITIGDEEEEEIQKPGS